MSLVHVRMHVLEGGDSFRVADGVLGHRINEFMNELLLLPPLACHPHR